jgi:non-ribosomal peptide synthetase component F
MFLEPRKTFRQLIEDVAKVSIDVIAHASLPYQHIVEHYYQNTATTASTLPYISTGLQFESVTSKIRLTEECDLVRYSYVPHVAKYDLWLSIEIDECQQMTGSFHYAADVFERATITIMADRFSCLISQLFSKPASPIHELSLLLPHEVELLHQLNNGDQLLLPAHLMPIHHQFACRAEEHPQKVAVILDDQCLTYAELLYTSQLLASHLIDECHVQPGDIIGQCVERSIEMVS